jgi:hypothetical protein
MFLTKGITNEDAQTLLPEYLAKSSDPTTRDQGMKMVRHLAEVAWSPVRDGMDTPFHYCGPKVSVEVATKFVETVLRHHEYELFNKAMGWFKNQVDTWVFTLVSKAAAEDLSFDFTQIKVRCVFPTSTGYIGADTAAQSASQFDNSCRE